MASQNIFLMLLTHLLLLLNGPAVLVTANPVFSRGHKGLEKVVARDTGYWVGSVKHQGVVAFGNNSAYQVYRNVRDFGAKGDGVTDDTVAINAAISSGQRCGLGCDSSTTTPALVYFPAGTYLVSKPIVQYYYTQMVGDATNLPVLKATAGFSGMAVIDADPYTDTGDNWYTNQNNFFRAIRNFVIDLTAMPQSVGAGIHWQVGQATSLQNIRFEMIQGGGDANKQQGIFMDNGSGGFMTDLTFNGGNYGMFAGNQQFTTRNLTFNNCNTGVYMNWNWAWTFKSVTFNSCGVGLNMSTSPSNQTVGSVLLLDSKFVSTPTGVVTAWTRNSIPVGAGTLVLDNVDFSGSTVAVAGVSGNTLLAGGSVVSNWVQGNSYRPSSTLNKRASRSTAVVVETIVQTVYECPEDAVTETVIPSLPTASSSATTELRAGSADTASQILPWLSSLSLEFPPLGSALSLPGFDQPSTTAETLAPATASASTGTSVPTELPSTTVIPTASTASSSSSLSLATAISSGAPHASSGSMHGSSGSSQCSARAVTKTRIQTALPASSKPSSLLNGNGKVFERSKPLYESYPASSFISVKSAGAKGDGSTDDTAVLQRILNEAKADQVVYFDHGAYILTDTLKVPANIKIVGEVWPLLMASGAKFSDQNNPIPLLQVGEVGDKGSVEISDLAIQTKGPAPGAILMQWNVAETSLGSAGMTELQSDKCPKTPESTTTPNAACLGAFMLLHITQHATAYMENVWSWTADHELDLADHAQINVYTGRGVLVESQGPVWLYGTAAEHNQLYNYQVTNAADIFLGLIQSETPYYQGNPNALVPFTPQTQWSDPTFAHCTTNACRKAWGLRVVNSTDLYVYGAGLYSFFENYAQQCIGTDSCQQNMVEVDCSNVHLYGLSTIASQNMITSSGGQSLVPAEGNESTYCSTIALFEQSQ
ncbi:hypothetical protein ARAM_000743 [Aspergillus rambellii]|uniref:Rhamnogalacturonase A/B/Epimerase-like pectate lyase domain-containing protein n=1 Tax=Aspergillus rambellii TaxID=308745 RepID=A0A0F8UEB0_9EURO|nr:hypothetical protein ARAM_000743 [Aspergillus rambellii]